MAEDIIVAEEDGVAVVTLNRPAKRNAVSLAMWGRLRDTFERLGTDANVRAVILTGAGGNFCAGADISEFATVRADAAMGEVYEATADAATRAVRDCPRPTIAAVSGYAMGGGCGLALACDFRLADMTAKMGIPAARLGIVYGPLDCGLLLRQVGLANAKRVLYAGRAFELADCREMGLVDMVAETGTALEGARAYAGQIAANAPLSIAGAKLVLEALADGTAAARAHEIDGVLAHAMDSQDYREGARAFVEKRAPRFTGN
ncbi:enoyl-CoA hydratase/carnithine racemase [Stella humosa]|uniref:Enoyl-CoA hydratase/carnithine racemase n=1 Tax=Stella humosa TaxID=94 RepID=A0A3N1KWG2_9PROT|nr:enoyl-CoA hydratase-related protein [Stella humosa]ROP83577.1 enoyl-CoA hydratase/carnithine racemase [Stella humosa]BBK33151.1 3-hydroxybutyryl-CoA dehydratase [Stella humosa]